VEVAPLHPEHHRLHRSGWLRAAVLGANDGLVSTSSLLVGVAAAGTEATAIAVAGIAALVAGALSMAAGEYVSVQAQADTEAADLAIEARALEEHRAEEETELSLLYEARGLEPGLAREVARQLMAHDALGAHARDEIGITTELAARPAQAAASSAAAFAAGGAAPVLLAMFLRGPTLAWALPLATLALLAGLGAIAGHLGGASLVRGALRVALWGAAAMALTAGVGRMVGATL
jgi:VIT1/CCC1 family predicted Fe2+/Mn2+ transporter